MCAAIPPGTLPEKNPELPRGRRLVIPADQRQVALGLGLQEGRDFTVSHAHPAHETPA